MSGYWDLAVTTVIGVAALAWVLWQRRHPRVWRREEVDEIRRRARERSEQTRQWADEPGYPTHGGGWYEFVRPGGSTTHIAYVHEDGSVYLPEGMDVVDETDFRLAAGTSRFWPLVRAEVIEHHIDQALDIASEVDRAKADHLNAAMQTIDHPYTHLTAEEAADCTRCSPSSLPRRTESGDGHD